MFLLIPDKVLPNDRQSTAWSAKCFLLLHIHTAVNYCSHSSRENSGCEHLHWVRPTAWAFWSTQKPLWEKALSLQRIAWEAILKSSYFIDQREKTGNMPANRNTIFWSMWYSNEQVKENLLEYVLSCLQQISEHYLKKQ